ncbi:sugar phosphate isomerase/epimerase family protein [Portibacter lacus]|uniref:Xylose isomerase n=1 Tax=Portibacter lacus TaxID=1099794 RepID=A0AA37WGD9_9BACT|nr:sugar phosphate isomerase/epimerase family protein [Portibacter lacus]GLR19632.1 xylose isomerase [Portibacter lacus]
MGDIKKSRRQFLQQSTYATGGIILGSSLLYACGGNKDAIPMINKVKASTPKDIKISLAQWSLNKEIKGGELDNLDFAKKAKSMGFEGIEYVNQFFPDKAKDASYLKEMNARASGEGVQQLLIMIDQEGGLAQINNNDLGQAIENHKKWVEAAKTLGCHSIRVNAYGEGSREDVAKAAVEGLGGLATFAKDFGINVIVENHGGYSSDGKWLSGVMEEIDMPNCGTLPDFGNFCITKNSDGSCKEEYDKYLGVKELMPYAKAVSAKSFEFDDDGYDTEIDYDKMMKIVLDAGYKGFVGIEYEGARMSAEEGIIATRDLIKKVLAKMS